MISPTLNRFQSEPIPEPTGASAGAQDTGTAATSASPETSAVLSQPEEKEGRNRLHKDPPAGHPAAQQSSVGEDESEEHHKGFREKLKEKLGLGHSESEHADQETRQSQ